MNGDNETVQTSCERVQCSESGESAIFIYSVTITSRKTRSVWESRSVVDVRVRVFDFSSPSSIRRVRVRSKYVDKMYGREKESTEGRREKGEGRERERVEGRVERASIGPPSQSVGPPFPLLLSVCTQ